jgi:DNA-binding phage protein
MEAEAKMKKLVGVASYHEWEVKELGGDREFAVEYLKAALESLEDRDDRGVGLLMLRALAEAYGGMGKVAAQAGIPTLKTLLAVLNVLGLRLSVVEPHKAPKRSGASKKAAA